MLSENISDEIELLNDDDHHGQIHRYLLKDTDKYDINIFIQYI